MADPYAGIAVPVANDPYAGIGLEKGGGQKSTVRRKATYRGKTVEFDTAPDISDAELQAISASKLAPLFPKMKIPTPRIVKDGRSDSSMLNGFAGGVLKPLDNLATAASKIPVIGPAIDSFGVAMGMPSTTQAVEGNDQFRAKNSRTGFQTLGNIAGVAPTLALPGGAGAQGAVAGGLLSDAKDAFGVAKDAVVGGVTSLVGGKALEGVGAMLAPQVPKALAVLNKAGIPVTLGQIAKAGQGFSSKAINAVENAARKLPLLKSVVNTAEDRGVKAYYDTVIKRTGVKVPDSIAPGHETTEYVGRKLSDQYDTLLPKLQVAADAKLATGLSKVEADLKAIAPSVFPQFRSILKHAGLQGKAGGFNGKTFQQADRVLRTQAEKFGKSLDPNQQEMSAAFDAVRQQMRGLLLRQNPQYAPELSALNKSWRELSIARKAAGDPNKGTGVFTPAKYATAAKGSRSNQELTRTADQILPNRSPDSGTTEGVGMGQLLLTGGAGYGATLSNPLVAIPAATIGSGSLLYTKAGQTALNKAYFATRPGAVKATGNALKKLSKLAPAVAPVAAAEAP